MVVRELHERGVGHIMIEGGAKINAAFLARGMVDELVVYLAPTLLGAGIPALTDLGIGTLAAGPALGVGLHHHRTRRSAGPGL